MFSPPAVTTGDLVRFKKVGSTRGWLPAVVMSVEAGGLKLRVFTDSGITSEVSVLHCDDPRQNDWKRQRNGMWDISDRERENRQRLDAVSEELRALRDELRKAAKKAS